MTRDEIRRQTWLAKFEQLVVELKPELAGKIDWNTAVFLFNAGESPERAAARAAISMVPQDRRWQVQLNEVRTMSNTIKIALSSDLYLLQLDDVVEAIQAEFPHDSIEVSRRNVDETRIDTYDNDPTEWIDPAVEREVEDRVCDILGDLWMQADIKHSQEEDN